MKTVLIFVNGILANPGDSDGWTDRAVTFTNTRTRDGVYGEKFEYATGPLTRRWKQDDRAAAIATMISYYRRAGFQRVIGVGHSNGCDILARVLTRLNVALDSVHLFAPAATAADYHRALQMDSVERIYIYGSRKDAALGIGARASKALLGWAGLGYGTLGLEGAAVAAAHPERVKDCSIHSYGHSDWFARDSHFEPTMRTLFENEGIETLRPPFTPVAR
jgi:hypothetical protein